MWPTEISNNYRRAITLVSNVPLHPRTRTHSAGRNMCQNLRSSKTDSSSLRNNKTGKVGVHTLSCCPQPVRRMEWVLNTLKGSSPTWVWAPWVTASSLAVICWVMARARSLWALLPTPLPLRLSALELLDVLDVAGASWTTCSTRHSPW